MQHIRSSGGDTIESRAEHKGRDADIAGDAEITRFPAGCFWGGGRLPRGTALSEIFAMERSFARCLVLVLAAGISACNSGGAGTGSYADNATSTGSGLGGTAGSTAGSGSTDSGSSASGPTSGSIDRLPDATGYAGYGPWSTRIVVNTGPAGAYTLFLPVPLKDGLSHPIITWGNGTGATPTDYKPLLNHLASHGFVIVASNATWTGTGVEMLQGLDWMISENSTAGSDYYQTLDTAHVAAVGHSQGGGGALHAAADPRITTIVPIEPSPQPDAMASLHQPMLLLCGGRDDVVLARAYCTHYTFNPSPVPTFYGILEDATHFTPTGFTPDSQDGFAGPVTAWLRYMLVGDTAAGDVFVGADCMLCSDSAWTIAKSDF